MAASPESPHVTYADWQPQFEAALLEANSQNLPQGIQAAEAAILERLQALSLSSDPRWEKEAIENALGALAVLKREVG
jgi:hypothetical protein